MSEFIVSFELMTIFYIIILIPVFVYLLKLSWWLSDRTIDYVRLKLNRKLVNDNQKILRENMDVACELMKVQEELLQQQLHLKNNIGGDVE